MNTKELNTRMYLLKAVAITTVVLAHTNCDSIINSIDYYLIKRLSAVGVFCFYFISGYYFCSKSFKLFWHSNALKLVVPWFSLGTFQYLLGCWRSGEAIQLGLYVKYILGSGSMYYFCTVLLIIRIVMNWICNSPRSGLIHSFFMIFTILSVTLSRVISPFVEEITTGLITPYLNIFHWIGIFSLGIVAREKKLLDRFHCLGAGWKLATFLMTVAVWTVGYTDHTYGYFGYYSIWCELGMMLIGMELLFLLRLDCRAVKYLEVIGKNTLPIYLLHYPLLSIMQKSDLLNGSVFFCFLRCIICASILTVFVSIARVVSNVRYLSWIKIIMGIN